MLLGAQTYTIRAYTQNERDFREAMRRVAAIGYKTVQLSAVGPMAPQLMRDICDENGLQIVLTHTNPERMLTDPDAVIRDHEIMGCKYIGIGGMPDRYRNAGWVDRFAKDFEVPAKKMRDAGKLLMIFWCLLAFFATGFEHSIANMTLLTLALINNGGNEAISMG